MAIDPREYIANDKIIPALIGTSGQVLTVNAGGTALEYTSPVAAVPTGSIIPWPSETLPSGFFKCNGDTKTQSAEAALYAIIGTLYGGGSDAGVTTFSLPNMLGKLVRGWDDSEGVDLDRANRTDSGDSGVGDNATGDHVGTNQVDSTARPNSAFTTNNPGTHTHGIDSYTGSDSDAGGQVRAQDAAGANRSAATNAGGSHAHTITGGGDLETVPVNIAMMWIIKY